jgi:hypothetical protein
MKPQRRAVMARSAGLALAALAGAFAARSPQAAPAGDALAPMVVLDAVYIPALASTTAAGSGAAAARKALAATVALRERWPRLRAALEAQPPSAAVRSAWSRCLDTVGHRILEASRLAEQATWPAAHEALEHIRLDLMTVRRAAGFDYYLDRLTAFHAAMEVIAQAGATWKPESLDAARRAELERVFAQASALWREVERHPADPRAYRLSASREAQWRKGLADEAAALTRLSDALRAPDAAALLRAAAAVKPPYARVFTAFGAAEGEQIIL